MMALCVYAGYWEKDLTLNGKQWVGDSTRMALTKTGWINATNSNLPAVKAALQNLQTVTSEDAHMHKESLEQYIRGYKFDHFDVKDRINPAPEEQTESELYSNYVSIARHEDHRPEAVLASHLGQEKAEKKASKVSLTPAVLQAVSCNLTGKPFKDPVVMKEDMKIETKFGAYVLRKGHSYEKSAVLNAKVPENKFYANFMLKRVIDSLGANDPAKLENLTEARLQDPVLLDQIKDPVILPSGHSYSAETIEDLEKSNKRTCPNTRQPFNPGDPVRNVNLDLFNRGWEECRKKLLSSVPKVEPSPVRQSKPS
jgi:hypothetical protein